MDANDFIKSLPSYFSEFTALVAGPKKFLLSKTAGDDSKEQSQKSIVFLFLSFVITLLLVALAGDDPTDLTALMSKDQALLAKFAGKAVVYLITIVFAVFAIRLSYRIVGGKADMIRSFTGFNYIIGMLMVFSGVIELGTNGIANTDPYVAKCNVVMEKEAKQIEGDLYYLSEVVANPNTTAVDPQKVAKLQAFFTNGQKMMTLMQERPIVKIALYVGLGGYIIAAIWLVLGIGFFRQINELSGAKNVFAIIISLVFLGIGSLVWQLASGGISTMKHMKSKYGNDTTTTIASMVTEAGGATTAQVPPAAPAQAPAQQPAAPDNTTATQQTGQEKTLRATIGGASFVLVMTADDNQSASGYLYATEDHNKRYSFEIVKSNESSLNITIKESNKVIASGILVGGDNGCLQGSLNEANSQREAIEICDK